MNFIYNRLIGISFLLLFLVGCNADKKDQSTRTRKRAVNVREHIQLKTPLANKRIFTGGELQLEWGVIDTTVVDSVLLYVAGKSFGLVENGQNVTLPLYLPVGMQPLVLKSYAKGQVRNTRQTIELISGVKPVQSKAGILRKLPHDTRAYTQGLEIVDGFFYESTGQHKESTMRKVDVESGKVIQNINLQDDEFGEGMTIFGKHIYQLTWQSNVGFVYDLATFKLVREFTYPTEGWGLTHNDEYLIMSDGSHYLYFLDPDYFTEVRKIAVYDNDGPVRRLNELEFVNGKILANIYGADHIVIIDPATGIMENQVDLSNLKKAAKLPSTADVLNGLAWDANKQKLYATGKYWPVMFEIGVKGINL
ncbi:MAG: glutaminyl-peptide cyclotransferase [Salinivirgaceae bacterium]|jgi:glutamine cyclotransferase|nr:glutaminyl-peptide cyclotransferase [Salinivirgaceae bacterium]